MSTRKVFLGQLASGGLGLVLAGCGGGGDAAPSPAPAPAPTPAPAPPPATLCTPSGAISANHGHTLNIPSADLNSTTAKTYSILGSAGHDHTIALSAAQFAQLKNKQMVIVSSSTDGGHAHTVTVTCA
jgi:hypothetical protein